MSKLAQCFKTDGLKVHKSQAILIDRYLLDDDTKFTEYFRLSPYLFNFVLAQIKDDLELLPMSSNKNPIKPNEKLCLTLR